MGVISDAGKTSAAILTGAVIGAMALSSAALAQSALLVTTGADSGDGSLRSALEAASAQAISVPIFVVTRSDIEITSTLTYSGRAPLILIGNGQTVRTQENTTLLALSEGADLSVSLMNFKGPGGFNIENRGDADGPGGKGIFIDVREDQTGVVNLTLDGVSVSDVAYHGIHVSDCDLADDCGEGSGGGGDGSPASITAHLSDVEIYRAGIGAFDADGIRIDERGDGSIHFAAYRSLFHNVGADGVELDEGDDGDVVATLVQNRFLGNGDYCNLQVLDRFLPKIPVAAFEDGAANEEDLPSEVRNSPDDTCFERAVSFYESGSVEEYEFGIDLDDGIDIDEAGNGDLLVSMTDSEIFGNLDEGVDFDEEDAGNVSVSFVRSFAEQNTDDGFRTSESGPGDLNAVVYAVLARKNGGNGLRFDEAGEGTANVEITRTTTADNDDGDEAGLRVTKEGEEQGSLRVVDSDFRDGIDARNVTISVVNQ